MRDLILMRFFIVSTSALQQLTFEFEAMGCPSDELMERAKKLVETTASAIHYVLLLPTYLPTCLLAYLPTYLLPTYDPLIAKYSAIATASVAGSLQVMVLLPNEPEE